MLRLVSGHESTELGLSAPNPLADAPAADGLALAAGTQWQTLASAHSWALFQLSRKRAAPRGGGSSGGGLRVAEIELAAVLGRVQ